MYSIKKVFQMVILISIILSLIGCTEKSDNQSLEATDDYTADSNDKVKSRLDMIFEGSDIIRYEMENDKGTALSIYVTSGLSGGDLSQKEEFVNTIVEGVKTSTEEMTSSNITLYFKLASTDELIYAFEKGQFINYE